MHDNNKNGKLGVETSTHRTFNTIQENVVEFLKDEKVATVTFSQGRYISKIRKLAQSHPDKVQITHENDDGSIVAHIPVSYVVIRSPRELTEEQKQEMAKRLRK